MAKLPKQLTALHCLTPSVFCCPRYKTASVYCSHPDLTNAASAIPQAQVVPLGMISTAGDPSKKWSSGKCCLCRPGMRADFSVFQHNLLGTLTGDLSALPEVMATFVDGQCSFGCSAFPLAPSMAPSATPSMAPSATPSVAPSTAHSTAASAQS